MRKLKKQKKEIKESNSFVDIKSLPNSSKFSNSMRQMLGSLMHSRNSLKFTKDETGRANILGVPFQNSASDLIKIKEHIFELTPEIYEALTHATYDGESMKNKNDILLMYNIIGDLGYSAIEDRDSKRKTFFTKKLSKLAEEIQNRSFEEITLDSDNDLEGRGVKIVIPSNIIDIYTRLETLLGLNLSGHTDTLIEASNLIDELYKRGEIQNERQYQKALDKFSTL